MATEQENMQVPELIKRFTDAAIEKGDGVGGQRDAELYNILSETCNELVRRGDRGNLLFERLLGDESPHVRLWVASQLLYFGQTGIIFNDKGPMEVLNELSASKELYGLSASIILKQYEKGELQTPLSTQAGTTTKKKG